MPYRELAAPPPLTQNAPPPQVAGRASRSRRPRRGVPVPVPDAEAPPEQTHRLAGGDRARPRPASPSEGDSRSWSPPSEDELPKFGEYVYVEELPEAITKVQPDLP